MPARRSRYTGPTVPRKSREWALNIGPDTGASIAPNAVTTVDLLAPWRALRGITRTTELTISEIHGHCHVEPALTETNDIRLRAAAGIAFLPDTGAAATDNPNPLTEHWNWQAFNSEMATFKATAAGAATSPVKLPELVLDMHTKAMRKQRTPREQLKLIFTFDSSTGDSLVFRFHFRILLLLP